MKLAIVHDWLTDLGGAEQVLIELHHTFPNAPIYTLFARKEFLQNYLPHARIITSWVNKLPFASSKLWAPFLPMAVEGFDFSEYETVLSSSVIFSKGLILRPRTRHVCYCYSPARMLWDRTFEYEHGGLLRRHILRLWDRQASTRVDQFVAISETVKKRIQKYYRQNSVVIYPPCKFETTDELLPHPPVQTGYYLIVARLHPHKNLGMVMEVFERLGYPLVVIGGGPLMNKLQSLATSNIKFLGHQTDEVVKQYYQHARTVIVPNEEDFGLTVVEAMTFGKPVLALARGGALETVIPGVTGEFFQDTIPASLADGIRRMREKTYDMEAIKSHAKKFSKNIFEEAIRKVTLET